MYCTTVEDGIGMLGIVYFTLPLLIAVGTRTWPPFYWGVAVWTASGLTFAIKHLTAPFAAHLPSLLERPHGALNCNGAANDGDQSGAPGFPSGHSATSAAFWMGAVLLAPPPWRPFVAAVGLAATAAMMWSRMRKRCHTGAQTGVGALLGASVSYIISAASSA